MNATLALDGYGLTKSVRIKLKRTHSGDIEEFEPQSRYCKAHIKSTSTVQVHCASLRQLGCRRNLASAQLPPTENQGALA